MSTRLDWQGAKSPVFSTTSWLSASCLPCQAKLVAASTCTTKEVALNETLANHKHQAWQPLSQGTFPFNCVVLPYHSCLHVSWPHACGLAAIAASLCEGESQSQYGRTIGHRRLVPVVENHRCLNTNPIYHLQAFCPCSVELTNLLGKFQEH